MFITWIDVGVIAVTLFSGFLSLLRGFLRESLSLITWLCSAILALLLYNNLASLLKLFIKSATVSNILAISFIFIIGFIIISYISIKFSRILSRSFMAPFDKFLGLIYGVARGVVIAAMLVFLTNNIIEDNNQKMWLITAKTYPMLNNMGEKIYNLIPSNFLDIDKVFSSIKQKNLDSAQQNI